MNCIHCIFDIFVANLCICYIGLYFYRYTACKHQTAVSSLLFYRFYLSYIIGKYKMLSIIFHWMVTLYPHFHIFFIPGYDIVLVTYVTTMILSWALLKGDCWITVIHKKLQKPDYEIGSDVFNITDMGIPDKYYDTVIGLIRLSSVVVFLGILMRNYKLLNVPLWFMVYIVLVIYLYLLAKKDSTAIVFQYMLLILVILHYLVYIQNYMRYSTKT